MNNRLNSLLLIMILWLTGACSRDMVDSGAQRSIASVSDKFNADGQAFLRFDISLPMSPEHSRATDFVDGTSSEFAVDWAHSYLLLFAGDGTPAGTRIASVYSLEGGVSGTNVGTATDQVTAEYHLKRRITRAGVADGDQLFAYIILNAHPDHFTVTTDDAGVSLFKLDSSTLYGRTATETANMSLSDFFKLELSQTEDQDGFANPGSNPLVYTREGATYFTMTNAYMATAPGGTRGTANTESPYFLSPINAARLFPREEMAANALPAAYVYVERAVAKVELTLNETRVMTLRAKDNAGHALRLEPLRWALLNAGRRIYLTKHIDDYANWHNYTSTEAASDFRFVEANPAAILPADYTDAPAAYRIRWATTPNYTADKTAADIFTGAETDSIARSFGYEIGSPAYVLENTMNVERMTHRNTTGVVIMGQVKADDATTQAEINRHGIMVMHRNNLPDTLLTYGQLRNWVLTWMCNTHNLKQLSVALNANDDYAYDAANEATWKTRWMNLLNGYLTLPTADEFYAVKTKPHDGMGFKSLDSIGVGQYLFKSQLGGITSSLTAGFVNGVFTVNDFYNIRGGAITVSENDYPEAFAPYAKVLMAYVEAALTYLREPHSNLPTFGFYRKGYMYYRALIRHFDDTESPWKLNETPQPMYTAYPEGDNRERNYLGRYGVVRNNWYRLQINSIANPGDVNVRPLNTSDADDRLEHFMTLGTYVMPWVVRDNHFYLGNPYDSYNNTQP